jgi:Mn-dependent DtxR family transcriptional regulator
MPSSVCTAGKEVRMADHKSVEYSPARKFLTAADVAEILNVSRSTAYRIIRRLNDELNKAGKITVAGKISARYFYENTYL